MNNNIIQLSINNKMCVAKKIFLNKALGKIYKECKIFLQIPGLFQQILGTQCS